MPTDYLTNDVAVYLSTRKETAINTPYTAGANFSLVTTGTPSFVVPNYEIFTDAGKPGNGHEFPTYQCITYVTHPALSITDDVNTAIAGRLATRALGGTITTTNPDATAYKHTNNLLAVASGRQLPSTTAITVLGGASFRLDSMVVDRFRLSQNKADRPQYQVDMVGTGKFVTPHGVTSLPTSASNIACLDGNHSVVEWTDGDGTTDFTNTASFSLVSWFVEIANNTKLNDRQAGDSELSLTYESITETPAYVSRLRRGNRVITAQIVIKLDSTIVEWGRYTVGEELTDVTFRAQGPVISGSSTRESLGFIIPSARIASIEPGEDDGDATLAINLQAFWDSGTSNALTCEVFNATSSNYD